MAKDIMNLHQKLLEVRKSVPYLKKSTKGYNYNYVSGTDVLSALKGKMDEMGLLLIPSVTEYEARTMPIKEKGIVTEKPTVVCKMLMTWVNADKPDDKIEVPFACFGTQDDISKAFGSALTYSERYFMLKFFNIPTDKDDPDTFQEKTHSTQNVNGHSTSKAKIEKVLSPTKKDESDNAKMEDLKAVNNVIARIHILKDEKKVTDDIYLDYILSISGGKAASSKDLNTTQKEQLVKFLEELPVPKIEVEKAEDKEEESESAPIFDDSDKFGDTGIKLQIMTQFELNGDPKESLMVFKLFGIAGKWVSEANPVSVEDLIKQHPSAKPYFKGVVLPRVSSDEFYKNALEQILKNA